LTAAALSLLIKYYFCGVSVHEEYISRCIQLAKNGIGRTYPNPMVGSVIVYDGKIIGEGWHRRAGEPHAEVHAINAVKDKELLKSSTIYVSLEPCSHYGKTPPCSNLIIESGIKKVVIGTVDPFSEVAGKGIKKLLDAGCEVRVGILEKQCRELNKRFFSFHMQKRPYVILKWAESADGFLSPPLKEDQERAPVWISNRYSKQLVHKWRSQEQSILVGTNTALLDDPQLNTRLWTGNNPTRLVIDRQLRIPKESALFDKSVKTYVLTASKEEDLSNKIIYKKPDFENDLPKQICELLYTEGIQSLIVEGGSKTLQSFIDSGLWDEARVFRGKPFFKEGTKAPKLSGSLLLEEQIGSDQLMIFTHD
jgi:diaminohydroxyphosphoribosylaminopyrimidine deaminase / 5-amino-6-(5-phosphoribosylamino)uracil reductase